jgi:hypothetical protein
MYSSNSYYIHIEVFPVPETPRHKDFYRSGSLAPLILNFCIKWGEGAGEWLGLYPGCFFVGETVVSRLGVTESAVWRL